MTVLVRIVQRGIVATWPEGPEVTLADDDGAAEWRALRKQLAPHEPVTVVIPNEATFDLRFPKAGASRRLVRRGIAELAPVTPDQLTWTAPRRLDTGHPVVTLVRRAWLDERIGRIEARSGLALRPVAEADLAPFRYRSPAERKRLRVTIALVCLPFIVLAARPLLREWARPAGVAPVATGDPHLFASPGFAAVLRATIQQLPPQAELAGVSRDQSGLMRLELDTADPDQVRSGLVNGSLASGLVDSGKARLVGSRFRLTFQGIPAVSAPESRQTGARLAAKSGDAARDAAMRTLLGLARREGLDLALQAAGPVPGRLNFTFAVAGPQGRVLSFANRVESTLPPMRIKEWRLVPDPAGVRLTGKVVVPWSRPS